MLQEFLDADLLPVTDEGYFEKLKKASDELSKILEKDKTKITSYILSALDPAILPDNPALLETKELITNNWSTFVTNSKDSRVTFIRAVMLEALELTSKDLSIACILWLSSKNIQQHLILTGKEKILIENFLLAQGNKIENKATEDWILSKDESIPNLNIHLKDLTAIAIDKATLQKRLAHASGPTDEAGVAHYKDPTELWPNSGQPWVHQFVPKLAQTITDIVNKPFKDEAKELTTILGQVQTAVNNLIKRQSLIEIRTQMLWWKESCYSTSLKKNYREIENGALEIMLANDYSDFIPSIYPLSIDNFLKETHRKLCNDDIGGLPIKEILEKILINRPTLKSILRELEITPGRISLLGFINGLVFEKLRINQFGSYVGFSENTEIRLSTFCLWIFHDFQALKLSITK